MRQKKREMQLNERRRALETLINQFTELQVLRDLVRKADSDVSATYAAISDRGGAPYLARPDVSPGREVIG